MRCLVTGASSGIGAGAARLLAEQGHDVVGAARRVDRIGELPGVVPLALDLADPAAARDAVAAVVEADGSFDVLVNNAGYGEFGSIEDTSLDDARRQLDVNVLGLVAVTQGVLPGMRATGRGRIVNVSSVAAEFSSPMAGWYHASKYAVEALTDSLRLEVGGFGVEVVVVQPGPVDTPWHADALGRLESTSGSGPYARVARSVAEFHRRSSASSMTAAVDDVAAAVVRAATVERPRLRYRVGPGARLSVAVARLLPAGVFDHLTRRQFGIA